MMTLSEDGHIRTTFASLRRVDLVHLISGLDDEGFDPNGTCGMVREVAGYTEWISRTSPTISLGWDWFVAASRAPWPTRAGQPRSNLMLMDTSGRDLGAAATARCLEEHVDTLGWERVVQREIAARYS